MWKYMKPLDDGEVVDKFLQQNGIKIPDRNYLLY